jgi:hypothetical protein
MRLRNVKGSRETIAANDFVIKDETEMKGKWHELFGNDNPIHIEIGMGKGQFIIELAKRNPDINYLGIEKYSSVLVRAIEKREQELDLNNLYFIRMDAEYITDVFDKDELSMIYSFPCIIFYCSIPKTVCQQMVIAYFCFFSLYATSLLIGVPMAENFVSYSVMIFPSLYEEL